MKYYIQLSLFVLMFTPSIWVQAKCDVVAELFKTVICQSDISLPNRKKPIKPLLPERILKIEKSRLLIKIRTISAEHLLSKESYIPTKNEIDTYHAFLKKSNVFHENQSKDLVSLIQGLLKQHQYSPRNKKRLEDGLVVFKRSVAQKEKIETGNKLRDEDIRKRFGEQAVIKLHEQLKQSRYRISAQWVSRWKMNKALYQKYGGRVIFQQAGIEPIDAYRAQLEAIKGEGGLKIIKTKYRDIFADFERYLVMEHNYLKDKKTDYFTKPYWETADLKASQQRTINDFKAIPHL